MQPRPLSLFGSFLGIAFFWFEKLMPLAKREEPRYEHFRLLKWLKKPVDEVGYSVGLYRGDDRKQYVIKSVPYRWHHLLYGLLHNEAAMLQLLNQALGPHSPIKVATFHELIDDGKHLSFIRSYLPEQGLFSNEVEYLSAFDKSVQTFRSIPPRKLRQLPRRSVMDTAVWIWIYGLIAALKDSKNWSTYLSLVKTFFTNLSSSDFEDSSMGLVHRDLTPQNIFRSSNKPALIDLETMAVGEDMTDIALLPRFTYRTMKKADILKYVESQISTCAEARAFVRLNIFYCLQFLAGEARSSEFYDEAKNFLPFLQEDILPRFSARAKSPYEKVSNFLLRIVGKIPAGKRPSVILCYHSVGKGNWRFTTTVDQFHLQLDWLKKHYQIVPLSQFMNEYQSTGKLAITFDDGYADVLENVAPLFAKKKITATMFALGNAQQANRTELDNQLPLLNLKELKQLKKQGWEIGFHTATHADLAVLNKTKLEQEIVEGKNQLDKKLGFKTKYFAYPRGAHNSVIQTLVQKAGFQAAFTVDGGHFQANKTFALTRTPMEGDVSLEVLRGQLSPLGMVLDSAMLRTLQYKEALQRRFQGKRI